MDARLGQHRCMRRDRLARMRVAIVPLVLLLGALLPPSTTRGATLPAGFSDTLVAAVSRPAALAFTPDGRLLIATQTGTLRVYANGTLLSTPALSFDSSTICTNSERGLLGIAVDPQFSSTGYIYLYYTYQKHGVCETKTSRTPVNRVSRFRLGSNNIVDRASEKVLIDNIPSPAGNHNAGDLHFGKDGYLYVSIGDGGCDYADFTRCAGSNDAARDQHVLLGKILRITRDGGIPGDNPFRGADSARCNTAGRTDPGKKCQETFAWGLRNPFRIAFDPNASGTRFFINDVGQSAWEEIDEGKAGADYGWNTREGFCANGSTSGCRNTPGATVDGHTDPIHAYNHDMTGCRSITGGAFVPNGAWPSAYDGAYLFSDYVCGKIFMLKPDGSGYARTEFATGLGGSSAVAMIFGPSSAGQSLYYTTYADGGQVRRIDFAGRANRAPTASLTANPTFGPAPLEVRFDGSGSRDPDQGDTLTYLWDFGDGTTRSTDEPTATHTYAANGSYTARLRVRDNRGATSAAVSVQINVGNTPPQPEILEPATSARFTVGQPITLRGRATDAEDSQPPVLTWEVTLHHADHTHPFVPPTSAATVTFTAPAPEDLAATTNSYLEIKLTATDSQGLSRTIRQDLRPQLVELGFTTQPAGLRLVINDSEIVTPRTLTSWPGYVLNVSAPAQRDSRGRLLILSHWTDSVVSQRAITTPDSARSYTAVFAEARQLWLPLVSHLEQRR